MKRLKSILIAGFFACFVSLASAQESANALLVRTGLDVFVIDPLTGSTRPLGMSDWLHSFRTVELVLSPDSSQLAVIQLVGEPSAGIYSRRLNIVDLFTGQLQTVPVAYDMEDTIEPTWSPDGRYVAYLIGSSGLPGTSVGIFDTQTGTVQRYPFGGENLRWSPNGQHLLVGMQSYIDEDTGVINNILMFDKNGNNPFIITSDNLNILRAEWLPDSSGIIGVCAISDEIDAFCQVAIGEVPAREAIILHQFSPGDYIRRFELIGTRIVFEYYLNKPPSILDLTTGQITPLETVGLSQFLDVLTEAQIAMLDNPPFLSLTPATLPATPSR